MSEFTGVLYYLLETWGADKCPKTIDFSKEEVIWMGLSIIKTKKDSKGIVEFKAYYSLDGEPHVMKEISRFVKIAGKWVYLDGVTQSV